MCQGIVLHQSCLYKYFGTICMYSFTLLNNKRIESINICRIQSSWSKRQKLSDLEFPNATKHHWKPNILNIYKRKSLVYQSKLPMQIFSVFMLWENATKESITQQTLSQYSIKSFRSFVWTTKRWVVCVSFGAPMFVFYMFGYGADNTWECYTVHSLQQKLH